MKKDKFNALDIFTITRPVKPAPKLVRFRATWPCGSTWEFDRTDLEIPEFKDGDQTGLTHCYRSNREAIDSLRGMGVTVERI